MKNYLWEVQRGLRSLAKRSKQVTYSTALALLFLMMGNNAFAEEANAVLSREAIQQSAESIESKIGALQKENQNRLKGLDLRLVQLMEQGDQVVKAPWSSWQVGMNYFYGNASSAYKGRGDKTEKYPYEGIFTRTNDVWERSVSPLSKQYTKLPMSTDFQSASSNRRTGISSGYGMTSITSVQEPGLAFEVNVGIQPKKIEKNPLNFNFSVPNVGEVTIPTVSLESREALTIPEITAPEISLSLPNPNTKPYNNFNFNRRNTYVAWGDDKEVTETYDGVKGADIGGTPTNILKYSPDIDWMAIHTVWNGRVHDTEITLKEKAAGFSLETWHAPKLAFRNTSVNIQDNENTVFYLFPAGIKRVVQKTGDYHSYSQRGAFIGDLDVNVLSQKNAIFSMMGIAGSFNISPEGKFNLEGANNLVFSGLGYSPNFQKLIGHRGIFDRYNTGMTPIINLKETPESYGDGNVFYYFSDLLPDGTAGYPTTDVYSNDNDSNWKKTKIGIHQGEIHAKASIGEQLAVDSNASEQTVRGENAGNSKYVENNAVVFAQSGQRAGIVPTRDLGMSLEETKHLDHDPIHALYVNDVNISFGKYSLKNIGLVADRGTQMDVAMPSNSHTENKGGVALRTTPILDYNTQSTAYTGDKKIVSSYNDANNEAATGTIFAYSKGTWKDSKTRMGQEAGVAGMSANTIDALKDKQSEINFGVGLITTARYKNINGQDYYPVAYAADGGLINAKNTEAKGYSSVVAYAINGGKINMDGKVIAKDEWAARDTETKDYLYKNIGAFSKGENSLININKELELHGMGAYAEDKGKVDLRDSANILSVGDSVGLIAKTGGQIDFHGGNIVVGEGATNNSIPFYTDGASGSAINFSGATNIHMTKGFIQVNEAQDYTAAPGFATAYNGMNNVNLHVEGSAQLTKISEGEQNVIWTGTTGIKNKIQNEMKLGSLSFADPLKNLSLYYINGSMEVDTNIDLDDTNEAFNNIAMERERLTINEGKSISSNIGKGLTVSSNIGASNTSNVETGYVNKGSIFIQGGSSASTVVTGVNYGNIENYSSIKLDNGTVMYGANGSTLINKEGASIEISGTGYGMLGMATGSNVQAYGKDAGAAVKAVEIRNEGLVQALGKDSVGLYASNNTGSAQADISLENKGKIEVGENGIGISITGSNGGELSLLGTGSSDIVVGSKGIGVYTENSKISMQSNYGMESQEDGVGIYLKGDSTLDSSKKLEYKYSGSSLRQGTAIVYDVANATNKTEIEMLNTTNSTGGLIGIYAKGTGTFHNQAKISGSSSAKDVGIVLENTDLLNQGDIELGDASSSQNPNIGIYAKTVQSVDNQGNIKIGNNGVGAYVYGIQNTGNIEVGDAGFGVYSLGGNINIASGDIRVGEKEAVGIYSTGSGQTITNRANNMSIGATSFGIVSTGSNNTIVSQTPQVNLAEESIFLYSKDNSTSITNHTNLTARTGNVGNIYGIYAAGTVDNKGDMDLREGFGNIGLYSIQGGSIRNEGNIKIGESDALNGKYSIGMAAGFAGDASKGLSSTSGNIVNAGIIEVNGKNSIGMYGTQATSVVENTGTILLNADDVIGIYADEGTLVKNSGQIKTSNGSHRNVTGIYLGKNAVLENTGSIHIDSIGGQGVYLKGGQIRNYGNISVAGAGTREVKEFTVPDATKSIGGVRIEVPKGLNEANITRTLADETVIPVLPEVLTPGQLSPKTVSVNSIGMYIDTSGIRYTNPIQNVGYLTEEADLIVGGEATKLTNNRAISIQDGNILKPYNESILNNPQVKNWNLYSALLTWMSTASLDPKTGEIRKLYLTKIPYTAWAGDQDSYNFTDGLEQLYGREEWGSRERLLFDKLNSIGNNEETLLYQAYDEMMGHQYANVQQRIHATGGILDKEFRYLRREWTNMSKDSNKVKAFGMNGEYQTSTAGIIDYTNYAQGLAYVHENETVKLGESSGWYTGFVRNEFKFQDIGRSKEEMYQGKLGYFRNFAFDDDGSLQWHIAGEGFLGHSKLNRRYLVVDEIFRAKSKFWSYGLGLKNEVSKEFRLSEDFKLRPYAMLDLEYGRFQKIRERSGEVRLEVKANDYYSIKPEVGVELAHKFSFGKRKLLKTSIGVAYENELGKVGDVKNRAKVAYTSADYYNLRGEKEDRRGNIKADLKLGLENTSYGVTANIGYDTKGSNIRAGLGLRVIF